jgi:hypothetical protein
LSEQTEESQPQEAFGSDFDGLRKAAAELNDRREAGEPISQPEPEPKEAVDYPTPREVKADPEDYRRKVQEKGPYLQYATWREGQVDARMGAEAISRTRSEGDEQLRKLLEDDVDLRDEVLRSVDQQNRASEQLEKTAAEAQAEIDRIKSEAAAREEQHHQREHQLAFERNLHAANSQVGEYQRAVYTNYFEKYPEAAAYLQRGDASQMADLAAYDPMRYREIVESAHTVDDLVTGRAMRVQQANEQYLQQELAAVASANKQYEGEAGAQRMREHAVAAVKARLARGQSQEQINADFQNPANYSRSYVEGLLAEGREFEARQGVESKRVRPPLPPVHRPGVGRDPRGGDYSEVGQLDKRLNQTGNVKDAGKLLAAMRRASR